MLLSEIENSQKYDTTFKRSNALESTETQLSSIDTKN